MKTTIQKLVTQMTRVVRNTDLDDPIQFHAFRQVAEEKIQEFADQQNKELREENKDANGMLGGMARKQAELLQEIDGLKTTINTEVAVNQTLKAQIEQVCAIDRNNGEICECSEMDMDCQCLIPKHQKQLNSTITRLRELLERTMPHVQTCEGSESKLLTEIDQTLKP